MIGRRSHDDAQAFEEACNGRTPRNSQIAELLRIADELCADAAAIEPPAQFRAALRTQLMTEAATVLAPLPATTRPVTEARRREVRRRRPARRRLTSLVAGVVASAAAVGIVASSASAVPGELLYPVKRGTESVELKLHRSDASRGSFQLSQASERLDEVRQLSADGRSIDLIADTLDDFSTAAAAGSAHLFSDFAEHGEQKAIRQVNDFATASSRDLSALSTRLDATRLPDSAAASFTAATAAVTDLASKASDLCSACAPADVRPLAKSVDAVTGATPAVPRKAAAPTPGSPTTPAAQSSQAPTPAPTQAPPSAAKPSPAPAVPTAPAVPLPAPTFPVPTLPVPTTPLSGLLDPLVGGLFGDEQQEGLVPGLLGEVVGGVTETPTPEP